MVLTRGTGAAGPAPAILNPSPEGKNTFNGFMPQIRPLEKKP